MVSDGATQAITPRYGPPTFAAALANILIVEFALWTLMPWFLLAVFVVPLLLVDLVVAVVLKSRRGTLGQIGRGMMIGLLAAPAGLALFVPGFMIAQAVGLV